MRNKKALMFTVTVVQQARMAKGIIESSVTDYERRMAPEDMERITRTRRRIEDIRDRKDDLL